MKHHLEAGAEVETEAFLLAAPKRHTRDQVRQQLVAAASSDGREIVSFGYDGDGLVPSVA